MPLPLIFVVRCTQDRADEVRDDATGETTLSHSGVFASIHSQTAGDAAFLKDTPLGSVSITGLREQLFQASRNYVVTITEAPDPTP